MRILLMTMTALGMTVSSALAADIPMKAPPPAPVPVAVWNWSGFYIGVNGGYSWGNSSRSLNFFNPVTGATIATATGPGRDINGGVFGGQIGYNWQASNWVFGIETDAQWTGQRGTTTVACPVAGCFPALVALPVATSASLEDKLQWFGTIRGRLGFTVTPNILLYGTGGGAYGQVQSNLTLAATSAAGVPVSAIGSTTTNRFGWTLGAGIEAMFASNWSAKFEYLYVDLGSISNSAVLPTASGLPVGVNLSTHLTDNVIRAGINYHFSAGPGPVVARY